MKATSKPSASSAARRRGCSSEALESYDGVEREERAVLTYLVGELWRRVGETSRRGEWFDRVADEMHRSADAAVARSRRASQQRDCPREWFG